MPKKLQVKGNLGGQEATVAALATDHNDGPLGAQEEGRLDS